MSIQILKEEVIDQIAAGEVVERPAHLVKELVENALDAGATELEIEFEQGGCYVKVSDNGCGISPEYLKLSVHRHATSKIQQTQDIWSLNSFGFRGEALATISAVSEFQIISKIAEAKEGHSLTVNFGHANDLVSVAATTGTTVIIKELFENIPARKKFLKSDAAEHSQIKNTLKALALAHSEVQFRVRHKGELLFFWPSQKSLKKRAETILDYKPLFSGFHEYESFNAQVAVGSPNQTVGHSRQIWVFVQKRWVQDRGLIAAVNEAYRSLLMHGEYPVAVVWLECRGEDVDVNVHPTKSQVKFLQSNHAFRAVHHAIRKTVEQAPWLGEMDVASSSSSPKASDAVVESNQSFSSPEFNTTQFPTKSFNTLAFEGSGSDPQVESNIFSQPQVESNTLSEPQVESNIQSESQSQSVPEEADQGTETSWQDLSKSSQPHSNLAHWSKLQVLGQADLTYIVAQSNKALVLVDQHAAHERVAYESLMAVWKEGQIEQQNFLIPFQLKMPADEVEALMRTKDSLARLGLELEQAGPETMAVNAAPVIVKESSIKLCLEKLAKDLVLNGESFAFEKTVGDICANLACHSVIRAGQALSHEEMQSLLEQMDQYPLSSFCPHGRPVFVEYTFSRLERAFGRLA